MNEDLSTSPPTEESLLQTPQKNDKKKTTKGMKLSPNWKYFSADFEYNQQNPDQKPKCVCLICKEKVFQNKMDIHLKKTHAKEFKELNEGPTGNLNNPLTLTEREKYIELCVITMIKNGLPFSLFSEESFILSQKVLNSTVEGISNDTLKIFLNKKIEAVESYIKENISKAKSLCLTADLWQSVTQDEYIAISAHWIDPNEWRRFATIICVDVVDSLHVLV